MFMVRRMSRFDRLTALSKVEGLWPRSYCATAGEVPLRASSLAKVWRRQWMSSVRPWASTFRYIEQKLAAVALRKVLAKGLGEVGAEWQSGALPAPGLLALDMHARRPTGVSRFESSGDYLRGGTSTKHLPQPRKKQRITLRFRPRSTFTAISFPAQNATPPAAPMTMSRG